MTGRIYDPTQIEDGVIRQVHDADPSDGFGYFDDMLYNTAASMPYESEGTFSVVAGRGGVVQLASGAVAGNRCRLNESTTMLAWDPTKDFTYVCRALTTAVVQVSKFLGLFSALPTAAAPSVEPANGIYFRALDVAGAVNYFAVTRLGGVETAVDTGILDSAVIHDFKIVKKGANVLFFIDGVQKANISTNLPIVALLAGEVAVTQEAVAKNLQVDTRKSWNKR